MLLLVVLMSLAVGKEQHPRLELQTSLDELKEGRTLLTRVVAFWPHLRVPSAHLRDRLCWIRWKSSGRPPLPPPHPFPTPPGLPELPGRRARLAEWPPVWVLSSDFTLVHLFISCWVLYQDRQAPSGPGRGLAPVPPQSPQDRPKAQCFKARFDPAGCLQDALLEAQRRASRFSQL